jgi:hypothetical protein
MGYRVHTPCTPTTQPLTLTQAAPEVRAFEDFLPPTEVCAVEQAICGQFSEDERQALADLMPLIRDAVLQSAQPPNDEEKSDEDWPFTDRFSFVRSTI